MFTCQHNVDIRWGEIRFRWGFGDAPLIIFKGDSENLSPLLLQDLFWRDRGRI